MSTGRYTPDQLNAKLAGGLIPAAPVMFDRDGSFHDGAHEVHLVGAFDFLKRSL